MTNVSGIANGYIQNSNAVDRNEALKPPQATPVDLPSTRATTSQDAARLSGTGSLLASAATNTADIRTDKVEALRSAILDGTYNVPASDVADRLLKHMLG